MHLTDLRWPDVAALPKSTPVVFPVAALEQHGHHLPLYTDSFLLGEIVRRTEARLRDRVLFAPLQWLGNSDHHIDFPGTISAPPRLYLDLLIGLAENFLRHGFQRLVFLNGHGGNDVPGRQVVFELRQRYRTRKDLLLLFATYWNLGSEPSPGFQQSEMGHACEWETSMILRLAPHLVGNHQEAKPVSPTVSFHPAARGWITRDRSEVGHIGMPHAATAEKGEILFERFAGDATRFLEQVLAWDGASWA
ncbi:MAG: creatininase family protein [Verrucomicrobiales bacterium]|nr:creatininase family protein [Verrucomicrobiales bacterium]